MFDSGTAARTDTAGAVDLRFISGLSHARRPDVDARGAFSGACARMRLGAVAGDDEATISGVSMMSRKAPMVALPVHGVLGCILAVSQKRSSYGKLCESTLLSLESNLSLVESLRTRLPP